MGRYDADVKAGDTFTHNTIRYEVGEIEPNRRVRTAAELTERGVEDG